MKVLILDNINQDGKAYILLSQVESIRVYDTAKQIEITFSSGKREIFDIDNLETTYEVLDFMRDHLGV